MPKYKPRKGTTLPDVGSFDVSGGINMPGGMGLPAALISIYRNKAAREAATSAMLEGLQALPENVRNAWTSFAGSYPRIAAHLRVRTPKAIKNVEAGGAITYPTPVARRPTTVGYTQEGLSQSPDEALRTAYHEGTHVAQQLGNRDHRLYALAQYLDRANNPFEVTARAAEAKPFGLTEKIPSAMRLLEELAMKHSGTREGQQILELLAQRRR